MTRSLLPAALLATLLSLPAAARADFGATFSLGGGVLNLNQANGNVPARDFRSAGELTPFYQAWIFRFEVGAELQISPGQVWAIRPGVKLFLPWAIYLRAGYGLGNLGGAGALTHSLVLGLGKEFSIVDAFGILLEATGEAQFAPWAGWPLNLMGRVGVFLKI